MADESHYSVDATATAAITPNKRKYDDQATTGHRHTGFSSPDSSVPPPSYSNVPPPADEIQLAKQKAQEIAARFLSAAAGGALVDTKRPRVENGGSRFDSNDTGFNSASSGVPVSYGSSMGGTNKRIEIPNGRVGVIIGKSGETIKYLQLKSGAKIQVTRDMDADLNLPTRVVELMGTPEQIETAERLINDVLAEADAGGSGTVSRRQGGQGGGGGDRCILKIPNNKVGLVIGKGGETIKSMQARTGARIQVIPLHLPPGDTTSDRNVHIDGTSEQVEAAKQLVNEVISENRVRNSSMGGAYSQQGYQTRPPANWGPVGAMQQPGYSAYVQPGPYTGASGQYNMPQPPYGGYPTQPSSAEYPAGWDQSAQQTSQGYDYYGQPPSSQQPPTSGGPAAAADNSGAYGYNSQQLHSGYNRQGYGQDGYGGYPQSGYGQPPAYDQQQQQGGYNSAPSYGQEGGQGSSNGEGDSAPQPSSVGQQQGYGSVPNQASYHPPQGATSQSGGYGTPQPSGYGGHHLTAQPGYGSSYIPPAQKPPAPNPSSAYGQTTLQQQSPSGGGSYSQSVPLLGGYPHAQPPPPLPPQSSGYGSAVAAQPGYGPPYGAPLAPSQPGYGPYGASYSNQQAGGYPTDGNPSSVAARAAAAVSAPPLVPPSQPVQQIGVAKASPKS